jgi:hypothetical protein
MSPKMRTQSMNGMPPSTGASTAPRSEWHLIKNPLGEAANSEDLLIDHLELQDYVIKKAGRRNQRHDLEIFPSKWVKDQVFKEGRYEVKGLYRKKKTHAWDRRIKVGSRGETIYGRRDAQIKALALDIEEFIGDDENPFGIWNGGIKQIEDMHSLIDDALERRHSKEFIARFSLLAEAYDDLFSLPSAGKFLAGGVQPHDIIRGFSDIDGIFVTAGDYFTLVSKKDIPRFFTFESVSVEGVKLKFVGDVPIET